MFPCWLNPCSSNPPPTFFSSVCWFTSLATWPHQLSFEKRKTFIFFYQKCHNFVQKISKWMQLEKSLTKEHVWNVWRAGTNWRRRRLASLKAFFPIPTHSLSNLLWVKSPIGDFIQPIKCEILNTGDGGDIFWKITFLTRWHLKWNSWQLKQ